MNRIYVILILILFASCSAHEGRDARTVLSDHPQTMATLYNYYSSEYKALCHQAFNIARERVDRIREDRAEDDMLAIVVDIDETLVDNSPHQALMIVSDSSYPYMWNEWCDLAGANAVPGSVDFLQYADEQGFAVFYVSNRKDKYVREATLRNLVALGFPQVNEDHFLLRLERTVGNPDPSDKQARRDAITAMGYEIVLLIGDNLGDFFTDDHGAAARDRQVNDYHALFGQRYIILPNAMYGNWPSSLGIRNGASMDSLLNGMLPDIR